MMPTVLQRAAHQAFRLRQALELRHSDGTPYLTRYVLWGDDALETHAGAAHSCFVHRIHGPDGDRHPHDHPWAWAVAVVLSGGYTEERRLTQYTYGVGDANILRPGDYHRITSVKPDTWTLFLCGRETSDWGFLVDGHHVPHAEYFKRDDAQHMTTVRL